MRNLKFLYSSILKKLKEENFSPDLSFNFEEVMRKNFSKARKHANSLMPKHIFLLEKVVSVLYLFAKCIKEQHGDSYRMSFIACTYRSLNYLINIRQLLITGFEDTCRVLSRSYLESLDISLACLMDKEFSERYLSDNSEDYNQLWRNELGYGKSYNYVRRALSAAGLPEEAIEEHIQLRKYIKNVFSGAVHCDESGAFRSLAIPPLGYPDMLSLDPHGVISIHTANHCAFIIHETFKHYSLMIKLMTSQNSPDVLHFDDIENVDLQTFLANAIAFQEIYEDIQLEEGDLIVAKGYKVTE